MAPPAAPKAFSGGDYPNLDFLRAWAVLFVCGSHLLNFFGVQGLWGNRLSVDRLGLWGVVIFFVHTCLVLMLSLERQARDGGYGRLFSSFMIRRIFRIYPLSVMAVASVVLFKLPVAFLAPQGGFKPWAAPTAFQAFSNFALVQDLTRTGTILGPLWSLPLEMQMYVLLPAIFVFTAYSRRPLVRTGALWVAGFALANFALRGHLGLKLALYAPCFLSGVIAYRLQKRRLPRLPAYLWPVALAGLTLFAIAETERHFLQYWIGALVLGVAIPFFRQISAPVVDTPSRLIARYSYGIYLSHFILIWLAFDHFAELALPTQVAIFAVTFAVMPVLLYHIVEEPMIRAGKRLANRVTEFALFPGRDTSKPPEPIWASSSSSYEVFPQRVTVQPVAVEDGTQSPARAQL